MNTLFSEDSSLSHIRDSRTAILRDINSGKAIRALDLAYGYIADHSNELTDKYGLETSRDILRQSVWSWKTKISFADFSCFSDIRNNFSLFFCGNFIWEIYRSQAFYIRFKDENPDLHERLMKVYYENILTHEIDWITMRILYCAYVIMIDYDEVQNNRALFA
jgi:hypothetical protein